jgi:hypothetical protein
VDLANKNINAVQVDLEVLVQIDRVNNLLVLPLMIRLTKDMLTLKRLSIERNYKIKELTMITIIPLKLSND